MRRSNFAENEQGQMWFRRSTLSVAGRRKQHNKTSFITSFSLAFDYQVTRSNVVLETRPRPRDQIF